MNFFFIMTFMKSSVCTEIKKYTSYIVEDTISIRNTNFQEFITVGFYHSDMRNVDCVTMLDRQQKNDSKHLEYHLKYVFSPNLHHTTWWMKDLYFEYRFRLDSRIYKIPQFFDCFFEENEWTTSTTEDYENYIPISNRAKLYFKKLAKHYKNKLNWDQISKDSKDQPLLEAKMNEMVICFYEVINDPSLHISEAFDEFFSLFKEYYNLLNLEKMLITTGSTVEENNTTTNSNSHVIRLMLEQFTTFEQQLMIYSNSYTSILEHTKYIFCYEEFFKSKKSFTECLSILVPKEFVILNDKKTKFIFYNDEGIIIDKDFQYIILSGNILMIPLTKIKEYNADRVGIINLKGNIPKILYVTFN